MERMFNACPLAHADHYDDVVPKRSWYGHKPGCGDQIDKCLFCHYKVIYLSK